MPLHARVYSKDEELGKRDDDFKPRKHSTLSHITVPWRWRKRRVAAVLALITMAYVLIRNMPEPLGPINERFRDSIAPSHGSFGGYDGTHEPTEPPPRPRVQRDAYGDRYYHDGPIKYYRLAPTLSGIVRTGGARPQNRNILFAVSSLKSAANLMPMACEMAKWDRNYVHMAFLGRDSLPLADILEINGVEQDACGVYFHDARSDYSEYSTDRRAEVAVGGAMKHIRDFMHPQAIIMDDSAAEDAFFTRAMRVAAKRVERALIEIPAGRYEEFLWMTRLDSGSLSNWFKPRIDILIHAPPGSSGSLWRVIRSLQDAYYEGLKVPRLTIELPSDIPSFAQDHLAGLQWPPGAEDSPMRLSTLNLRHRIPSMRITSEQASLRYLESFYPANTADDHVLVLSPQAELSPLYLQYLHYTILEYRYSSYGSPGSEDILGVSLDVPTTFLNGSAPFVPPKVADMTARKYDDTSEYDQAHLPPFQYQAPSATASLIFGDKWTTLHNFLSHRLEASHLGKAARTKKFVSETEPAWLEYVLELMRVRGWSMLLPSTPLVTIHNELAQIPEEFLKRPAPSKSDKADAHAELKEEAFLIAEEEPHITEHIERDTIGSQALHELLPLNGDLPEVHHLSYMSHTGDLVNSSTVAQMRDDYIAVFKRTIGGCDGPEAFRKRVIHEGKTDDLFCLPGIEVEYEDEDEDLEASNFEPESQVETDFAPVAAPNLDPNVVSEVAKKSEKIVEKDVKLKKGRSSEMEDWLEESISKRRSPVHGSR